MSAKHRVHVSAGSLPDLISAVQQALGLRQRRDCCLEIVHSDGRVERVEELRQLHDAGRLPERSQVRAKVRLLPLLPLDQQPVPRSKVVGSGQHPLPKRKGGGGGAYSPLTSQAGEELPYYSDDEQLEGGERLPQSDVSVETAPLASRSADLACTRSSLGVALGAAKMRIVKHVDVPNWFQGKIFVALNRVAVRRIVCFVVACGNANSVLLFTKMWCKSAEHPFHLGFAGVSLIVFWCANAYAVDAMQSVWRPMSCGGGAITKLAPPGTRISERTAEWVWRTRLLCIALSLSALLFLSCSFTGRQSCSKDRVS